MKTITFILILLFFMTDAFSQTKPDNEFTKEYYLQKSKNQKTAAWILLGAGSAITISGLIYINESSKDELFGIGDGAAYYLTLAGITSGLLSIPLFISSAKNSRRAANVTMNIQPILLQQQNNVAQDYNPSIFLKIKF